MRLDIVKVLIYPHVLEIGGAQLNAIEIAGALGNLGHEIIVFGPRGALNARIDELGLEFIESPDPRRRPSPTVVRALTDLIDSRGLDIVHGHEWPPALECLLAARRRPHVRAIATVASMAIAPFIPRTMPMLVGTEQIEAVEREAGRTRLGVLEPPVDVVSNCPGIELPDQDFRRRWGVDHSRKAIVCVSRLAHELKLEGILTAIDAIGDLSRVIPVQLVIVGDGPERDLVHRKADEVNRRAGAGTVILTGELIDPRAAYAAADVALGMGASALRAMAFAKPLVVQGENGFWRLLTPQSVDEFLWTGWYGYGVDRSAGTAVLTAILQDLLSDPVRRSELGDFGRRTVERRFSLTRAAVTQLNFYEYALAQSVTRAPVSSSEAAAAVRFAGYHVRKRIGRALGTGSTDDFNANPVARAAVDRRERAGRAVAVATGGRGDSGAPHAVGPVVWLSGVSWDAVAGTDRQLVTALARHQPVVWVDPPMSWLARRRRGVTVATVTEVGPRITRVHTVAPPGVGRPGVRAIAGWLMRRNVAGLLKQRTELVTAIVASSPEPLLRMWRRARALKVYYATDDFVAGAGLLGCSTRHARRARSANLRHADLALAVSEQLTRVLALDTRKARVLPNGCDAAAFENVPDLPASADILVPAPIAGVVGQLNDRLDLSMLEAVADNGDSLLLVGPRYEECPETARRLDALIARDNVQWVDRQPFERLPGYFAAIDVGLTPYVDNAFNRASYPLKTLDYLASGLPVVSTDIPSARSLATDQVICVATSAEFSDAVHVLLKQRSERDAVILRQEFARAHSWDARADDLRASFTNAAELKLERTPDSCTPSR